MFPRLLCILLQLTSGLGLSSPATALRITRRTESLAHGHPQHVTTTWMSSSSSSSDDTIYVAMTREDGKNAKLCQGIESLGLHAVELPCIEHAHGPDFETLPQTLYPSSVAAGDPWDYVIVTSPEAAKILSSAWDPQRLSEAPAVAAVGAATQVALESYGIPVAFTPSKATAVVLAKELPISSSKTTRVLYPASVRAAQTLATGLQARGIHVTRLNTYDTVQAQWTQEQHDVARQCQIACFASPSAVKGWLANTQIGNSDSNAAGQRPPLAACIGETSAQACREQGWSESDIFYPQDAPGMEGWITAVQEATECLQRLQQPM